MASNRRITVEFLGKDVSAGSTAAKVEQKFGKLGGRLDRVGQMAGKVLVAGAVAGGVALFKMGQSAAADEAAQSKLANTLRNTTGASDGQIASTEKWIEAQGKATGITDDELRPALARFAAATGDVGKSQELAALAMDVAAGTGKSYAQVSEAMARAQNGNIGALGRLGIKTKDAEGKTKSLKSITKDLADTHKGAAADAADTAAGKQKILTTQLGELGEKIGAAVLPALEAMVDIGLQVTAWVSNHTTLVGTLVAILGGLAAGLWIASTAMRAVATATKVWSAITKVMAGVQMVLNAVMAANPIALVIIAIVALVAALVIAYKKSDTFRAIVQKAFEAVAKVGKWLWNNALKPAFDGMKTGLEAVGKAGIWLWNNALQPAFKFIVKGIGWVLSGWASMLHALGKVPGFGWAKSAADLMDKAADKANAIANGLNKIPTHKEVRVTVTTTYVSRGGPGGQSGAIPKMAAGGIVTRPTLALIGEAGPEAVVPLKGSNPGRLAGATGGGIVINFNGLVTDPRAAAREIRRLLLAEKRMSGADLGLA